MFQYSIYSDKCLVELLHDNSDTQAYAELFDRYQPLMYIYACKITKNMDEAADLVQDVFLNLWEKRDSIILANSLSSYLYQAVRFKFFNLLDKKKVRLEYIQSMRHFMEEGSLITDHQIREKEMMQLLEEQIELLPPKLKQVYLLSRKANLTNAQIAESLNISQKTVNNRLSIVVKQLKENMGVAQTTLLLAGTEVFIEVLKKI